MLFVLDQREDTSPDPYFEIEFVPDFWFLTPFWQKVEFVWAVSFIGGFIWGVKSNIEKAKKPYLNDKEQRKVMDDRLTIALLIGLSSQFYDFITDAQYCWKLLK